MKLKLPPMLRTMTFRLALGNFVLFFVFSVGLFAFIYFSTVGYIKDESNRQVMGELNQIGQVYGTGGFDSVNQYVAERAAAPGPFLYYLQGPDGRKVSGDFSGLPLQAPLPGEYKKVPFTYRYRREERSAEGRAVRLANGGVLLVAYDFEERTRVVRRITEALLIASPIALILSLLGGVAISWGASRRADALVRTTEGVMAGDLSLRAPGETVDDEFGRLSKRLNAMLAWLETLVESTRDTGNAIAHDLRSPLTRLRHRLETATNSDLDAEGARQELEQTLEEVDRVLATFSAILRLSRLQAGGGSPLVPLDASEIVAEMAEMYEPVCEDEGVALRADIGSGLGILGDRELLGQAIANLIDNAIKYAGSGGTIIVSVSKEKDSQVAITVTDTGPGIPEADRERALKRFVRLETERTTPGSGLGLSLVSAVAEHHAGRFELDDGDGPPDQPGLAATLYLPRAK